MLYILTPCSRVENLDEIYKSIYNGIPKQNYQDICWIISLDKSTNLSFRDIILKKDSAFKTVVRESLISNSFVGHSIRNEFLKSLKKDKKENIWVYFLDDDTLLHEDFFSIVNHYLNNTYSAIIFSQENPNKSIRCYADYSNIKVGHIDMGQYLINFNKLPKDLLFKEDDYCADGIFIQHFFKESIVNDFKIINKVGSTYNKLR